MKELFLKIKNLSLITITASAVIGLVLLIWPDKSIAAVSILCGAVLILLGVVAFISYFKNDKSTLLALLGAVSIIAGIIICVKYKSIIAIILFLFGLFITASGFVDLITSFFTKILNPAFLVISTMLSIATIILGIVIMVNPIESSETFIQIAGVGLIVYAVMDLFAFFEIKKFAKNVKDNIDTTRAFSKTDKNEIDTDGHDVN